MIIQTNYYDYILCNDNESYEYKVRERGKFMLQHIMGPYGVGSGWDPFE